MSGEALAAGGVSAHLALARHWTSSLQTQCHKSHTLKWLFQTLWSVSAFERGSTERRKVSVCSFWWLRPGGFAQLPWLAGGIPPTPGELQALAQTVVS